MYVGGVTRMKEMTLKAYNVTEALAKASSADNADAEEESK